LTTEKPNGTRASLNYR